MSSREDDNGVYHREKVKADIVVTYIYIVLRERQAFMFSFPVLHVKEYYSIMPRPCVEGRHRVEGREREGRDRKGMGRQGGEKGREGARASKE